MCWRDWSKISSSSSADAAASPAGMRLAWRSAFHYIADMDRAEVIDRLKATEPALRSHGVAALFLFGSFARGTADTDSDVDLFIDPDRGSRFGFDDFMDSYETVRAALPSREIGFSTREGIGKHVRPDVERQAIRIF